MHTRHDINILLLSLINSESNNSTYCLIAQKILKEIDNLHDVSIQELADICHVSTATISRFCRALNLDSFYELKYMIHDYRRNPVDKFNINGLDAAKLSLDDFIDLSAKNILSLKKSINIETIDAISNEIIRNDNVIFMGVLQSGNASLNLQYSLTSLGIVTQVLTNPLCQLEILNSVDKNTFVLVFSKSGTLINQLYNQSPFLRDNRPKIGLITQNKFYKRESYIDYLVNLQIQNNISTEELPFNLVSNLITLRCYCILNNLQL